MTRNQILLLAAAILLLLLLLYLLYRFLRGRRSKGLAGKGAGQGQAQGNAGPTAEQIATARLREMEAKAGLVREVLKSGDELLVRQLLRRAGKNHLDHKDVSASEADVMAIATKLQLDVLEAFRLAATQTDIDIDMERRSDRQPASTPTSDISPEMMADVMQMSAVVPEQLMLPDDQFYQALAEQQLTILQPYEEVARKRRLYLLLDVSGSMGDQQMRDGRPRHVWARGVAVNLLLKALRGEAEYVCRAFDGEVHAPIEARNEAEAIAMIDHLLDRGFSGGGTDIMKALKAAADDIRSRGEAFETDILLISDGEAELKERVVRDMLGSDIRLHVMQIGGKANPTLRALATTCREL